MIFFNVGQGDSALINLLGDNEILIDGGPDNTVLYKLGKYLPIYNRDIELMILTHPHADHVTGLVSVLKKYKVERVMYTGVEYESEIYGEFLESVKGDRVSRVDRVDKVILGENIFLEVIYPKDIEDIENIEDVNDTSIVFKLDTSDKDFLFTGDISVEVEKYILENINNLEIKTDVLKVAHQGAETSSSQEFLEIVDPEAAVISVGKNSFGHPSLRVIKRLERLGVEVYRTDVEGDVVFKIKNQ